MAKKKDSNKGPRASVKATPEKATPEKATPEKATPEKATPEKATPEKARGSEFTDMLAPSEVEYHKNLEDIADNEDTLDIVSFYLNDILFAVEVEHIGAVIRSREILALPHTPDFIDGLISVRGEMILVMNLKRRIGIDPGSCVVGNIIVTESSSIGNETGMIVDRMVGVLEVAGKFKEFPKGSKGKKGEVDSKEEGFIKGTLESDDRGPIKVLDMQRLMAFDMPAGPS